MKKTATALRGVGVKKGDIITVVSVMTPEVIYAFYSTDSIGATLNLVDPATASRASAITLRKWTPPAHLPERGVRAVPSGRQARTHVERVIVLSLAELPAVPAQRRLQDDQPR